MKQLLVLLATSLSLSLIAQPGIYTEADIEYQTLFIEALADKYKGDTEETITELNKVIKRDRQSDAAYNELAKTYLSLANYELAEKNAVKAYELKPNNVWYLLNLGMIYEKSHQDKLAIETYKKLKSIEPGNPTTYHRLAMLQLKSNQPDAAATTLESLQAQQGVDEETSRRIFEIYSKDGQKKKAIGTLIQLNEALQDNPRLLNNLATYYMEVGQESDAKKVYTKILEIDPTNAAATVAIAKSGAVKAESNNYLNNLMPIMENMNVPLADKIKELMPLVVNMKKAGAETNDLDAVSRKLQDLYPEEAIAYSLRGDILFYQGQYAESAKVYKRAIELDDRKFTLWTQYIINLWELADYATMAKVSESAIDLYPNKVTAFLYHAISLSKTNDSSSQDYITEAGFIAGKNTGLSNLVELVKLWVKQNPTAEELKGIDIATLNDPLYMELAADLYAKVDNKLSKKLYEQAINMGSNADRINKKLGLE